MTNEEWAIEIQEGREDYTALWEQVRRFVCQQANRYFAMYCGSCTRAGVELDDLIQCGFMALRDAVRAYRPENGYSLLAYMKYPLLNHFRAACGVRTARRDPLNNCASLDKPVGDEGETTLGDLQPSQSAAQDMEAALEREYMAELHEAIETALNTLDAEQSETIRRRFWDGNTLQDAAKRIGVPPEIIRQREAKALRRLRRGPCVKLLKPFVDEHRDECAWIGTGWGSWNSTGASSVERAAEKTDELIRRIGEQRERDKGHLCALFRITPEEFNLRYGGDNTGGERE